MLHSPHDVQFCVLTDPGPVGLGVGALAAALPPADGRAVALIGNDAETVAARIAELLGRSCRPAAGPRDAGWAQGRVPAGHRGGLRRRAAAARCCPGVVQILREGPRSGCSRSAWTRDERLLPEECHGGHHGRARRAASADDEDAVTGVRPDLVGPAWCDAAGPGIAPVRDVSDSDDGGGPAGRLRLLDVLGLEPPTPSPIAARWRRRRPVHRWP